MISLLLTLALSQTVAAEVPVFDQKSPTIIECIVAVPESVKDPAKATDAKEAYKIVTFQDEKAVLKLAADLKYDVVSCGPRSPPPTRPPRSRSPRRNRRASASTRRSTVQGERR